MRKEVKLLSMFSALVLLLVPLYSSCIHATPQQQTQDQQTTRVLCIIGKQRIVKELPVALIESLLLLGKTKREDFLTIYNKHASDEEVTMAFQNIQPFFQELARGGLTDKSVEDLNDLFHTIREMIKKPRWNPKGPQPCGSWNGLPTFLVGNSISGIFCADGPAVGFALGTHTLLPTIGADAFITWAGTGETVSIGSLGFTTSTGPEFGCIFGFIGVLLATPIMIAGLLFMTGFAAFYLGIGPAPF